MPRFSISRWQERARVTVFFILFYFILISCLCEISHVFLGFFYCHNLNFVFGRLGVGSPRVHDFGVPVDQRRSPWQSRTNSSTLNFPKHSSSLTKLLHSQTIVLYY
jgi:hypothetical protein